jgi:sulfate adenylyltransferase
LSEGGESAIITNGLPHGGVLTDLLVQPDRAAELRSRAARWPDWQLTRRQRCDLELLGNGGFSPLRTFLGEADYTRVCESMRLADGTLWPIPVTLDLPDDVVRRTGPDGTLALRDTDGSLLGVLRITQAWHPDLAAEAAAVFGTTDPAHPGAEYLLRYAHPVYVTGELEVLQLPAHAGFRELRHTPAQVRAEFARRGWHRVVAFQTRNPLHRAHQELTLRAAREADAQLLIHPVVGVTKPGDIDYQVRVRCYQAILPHYPEGRVLLSLLPLAMRMGGPREALWHAIIRKNYGATHFIVGRDHAGPGLDSCGRPFYPPYAAQDLLRQHSDGLGVGVMTFRRLVYVPEHRAYLPEDEVPAGLRSLSISGTELRHRLTAGLDLPAWFTPPEIGAELRRSYPAPARLGAMAGPGPVAQPAGVGAGDGVSIDPGLTGT